MTTITSPRHMKPRPGVAARVAPWVSSRRRLTVTGTVVGIPAALGAAGVAAPAHAAGVVHAPATASHLPAAVPATPSASVVVLSYGSRGSLVKTAQQRLGGLTVDGIFGPMTLARVKAYQRSHQLVVDGVIGPKTWASLGGFPGANPAPPPTSTPPPSSPAPPSTPPSCDVTMLRYGMSGNLVRTMQQRIGGLVADGIFGPATLAAVKSYQGSHGLAVDGVVGPATWASLGGYPCSAPTPAPPPSNSGLSQVVSIAKQYLGVPYVWGGENPATGFDCSGLTQYVYNKAGLYIPRVASAQQRYMHATSNPVPGDLVFYGTPAYHVGIYLGNNQMIVSPHPGTVVQIQTIWGTPSGYGHLS